MTIVDQALALGLPVFTGQTLQRPTEEMSALSNQIAEKETPPFGSKKNGGVSRRQAEGRLHRLAGRDRFHFRF
jgi:hypothetical protein